AFYVLLWLPTLVYLPVLLNLRPPVFHAVWTPYTYTLIGGVAALLFGFLLLLLPAGTSLRALIFGILLGAVCVGAGIAGYMKIEEDDPLRIIASMVGLFGVGSIVLCLLVALARPLETALPYLILFIFVGGLAGISFGAWGHYHVERLAEGEQFQP